MPASCSSCAVTCTCMYTPTAVTHRCVMAAGCGGEEPHHRRPHRVAAAGQVLHTNGNSLVGLQLLFKEVTNTTQQTHDAAC